MVDPKTDTICDYEWLYAPTVKDAEQMYLFKVSALKGATTAQLLPVIKNLQNILLKKIFPITKKLGFYAWISPVTYYIDEFGHLTFIEIMTTYFAYLKQYYVNTNQHEDPFSSWFNNHEIDSYMRSDA